MKRFINLTAQYYAYDTDSSRDLVFAWLDTITDKFETHNHTQVWTDWEEFVHDYEGDDIKRYEALFPKELR